MREPFTAAALALLLGLTVVTPVPADILFLSSGGRVEGTLLNPNESPRESYVVQTRFGGRVKLAGEQVKRVVVKSEAERRYEAFLPDVPDTAEGHWDVAQRCQQAGLTEQREYHLRQVLRHEADHEPARHALGYSRINGRWMRQEDWMVEQGYVRHRGAWRLPQEIEFERLADEAEQATIEWRKKLNMWEGWIVKRRGRGAEGEAAIRSIRDPRAAQALAAQVQKEKQPRQLRLLYLDVLSQIGGSSVDVVCTHLALTDTDPRIRERCLEQLAKTGSPYAVAAFVKSLQDDENNTVQRAAAGLARLQDPSATLPLIEALVTEHKRVIGGGAALTPSFSEQGSSFSAGGRPKVVRQSIRNEQVLNALTNMYPGVNYVYDEERWKSWYVEQATPKHINLRRGE